MIRDRIPDNGVIYRIITMNDAVSHTNDFPDFGTLVTVCGVNFVQARKGFSQDFKLSFNGRPQHQITDADRVLVTREDVMSTRQQVQTLTDQGFSGCFSFEPFSQDVQNLDVSMLTEQLKQSFSLLFD